MLLSDDIIYPPLSDERITQLLLDYKYINRPDKLTSNSLNNAIEQLTKYQCNRARIVCDNGVRLLMRRNLFANPLNQSIKWICIYVNKDMNLIKTYHTNGRHIFDTESNVFTISMFIEYIKSL